MGNQERVFAELVMLVERYPTGWHHRKERKEDNAHPELVFRKFYHNGSTFKVYIEVDGGVKLSEYSYEDWKRGGGHWFAKRHKIQLGDDLTPLVEKVKQMIEQEEAAKFAEAFKNISLANGITPQQREEREEQYETRAVVEPKPEPEGFWARLFGG